MNPVSTFTHPPTNAKRILALSHSSIVVCMGFHAGNVTCSLLQYVDPAQIADCHVLPRGVEKCLSGLQEPQRQLPNCVFQHLDFLALYTL